MTSFFKKWRYQIMDRRMKVPVIYFILVALAFPVLFGVLISGLLNFTALFIILGFVFLGLYMYVRAGQSFFGKKKER